MATLVSPGVDVSIVDESSYSTTGTGTVPLIILGTHEYKTTPSGSIASGTTSDNAGKLYYISSQRDVVQNFGNPVFYTSNGTALDGYELNEYGLNALYQTTAYTSCYVLRAAVDYSDLVPSTTEPRGEPADGTIWLNPSATSWGIYQSNGSTDVTEAWVSQSVTPIVSLNELEISIISNKGFATPNDQVVDSTGAGNFVLNNVTFSLVDGETLSTLITKFNAQTSNTGVEASIQYIAGQYYLMLVQDDVTKTLTIDYDGTNGSSNKDTLISLGFIDTNTMAVISPEVKPSSTIGSNGDFMVDSYYASNIIYQKIVSILASDPNSSLAQGIWYIVGSDSWVTAKQNGNKLYSTTSQQIPASSKSGDVWFNISPSGGGLNFNLKQYSSTNGVWSNVSVNVYKSLSDMIAANPGPSKGDIVAITPFVVMDGNINNTGTQSDVIASSNLLSYNGTNWVQLNYVSSLSEPTTTPDTGTLWFNNSYDVDIMVNLNGNKWVGYKNYSTYSNTDPNGPIMAGSKPTTQSNGNNLVEGDIWIDTSDTENYPMMYRYKTSKQNWVLIDKSDHITPSGIVFADAREDNGSGSTLVTDMLVSDFVDPDAPNPELYPQGTLLFNTRYSTNNVKEWHPYYFTKEYNAITENGVTTSTDYTTVGYTNGITNFGPLKNGGRWVSVSGLNSDGSPKMGRHAQRAIIVKALKEVIQGNEDIKSETFYFSLIAAPGYPELISDMVELSDNIKNKAFVVGDTPARLRPISSDISSYLSGTGTNDEFSLTTSSPYLGVFYPWGKSENYDGSDIVVPPSTMMLRTIINSDNMSYPWYPPAGYTRGLIDNATSVGYIDPDTSSYTVAILNQSQRDLLYQNNINPIAYMAGKGLVCFGQKTRNATTTAMDRINVARLVCYLSYKLDQLAKPFLFELNTTATRANVKSAFDRFLSNIVTLQGITDFVCVCDTTNNTDATIDANELWIDIAVIPTRSIEFIYIPVRIMNTGSDLTNS